MFTSKKKLRSEITRLQYRVAELEERLCPCESHEWKQVGYYFVGGTGRGDETTIYDCKCKRCGKRHKSLAPLYEGGNHNVGEG